MTASPVEPLSPKEAGEFVTDLVERRWYAADEKPMTSLAAIRDEQHGTYDKATHVAVERMTIEKALEAYTAWLRAYMDDPFKGVA